MHDVSNLRPDRLARLEAAPVADDDHLAVLEP
jgi:hypothetical protein